MNGGKPSVTHYDTLEAFRSASLVDVKLETGRTHQIRVHFSAMRHRASATSPTAPTRPCPPGSSWAASGLHARELGFIHPRTQDEVRFVSDYPDDWGTRWTCSATRADHRRPRGRPR
ncbi:hypothetical protein GCM10020358_10190 [Amorphoplanes nipponensis]